MSPAHHDSTAPRRKLFAALLIALVPLAMQIARAGSLSSIAPAGVSVGQAINITGTGFDPTASNNTVTFTPTVGTAPTANGTSIATLDPTSGLRRLTVTVPGGLAVGTVSVRVRNRVSGETSDARPLDIVSLSLPDVTSASPGATSLVVRVTGSPNSQFVAGNTRATFGAGITVRATTVDSATSLRATIDVASTATLGPRDVAVISTTQRAVLTGGFTVGAPPPTNQAPSVNAGPDLTVTLPDAATLNGTASDDGLPAGSTLTTTWTRASGPGTVTFANPAARSTTATFSVDGTYVLRLTASDSALSAFDETTITVKPANRKPTITSSAVVTGAEGQAYSYQLAATDPDGDPLTFTLTQAPQGMTLSQAGLIAWTPAATQLGPQDVAVQVSDGRGGLDTQSFSIVVAPVITAIDVTPVLVRFSTLGATRPLIIAGVRPDGSTLDLTGASDLTFTTDNPFVATVDATGIVHAVANGNATVTVTRGSLTDTAAVTVETGVTLESIDLSPATQTLRSIGASLSLSVRGHFSNGDVRDLTTAAGTTYDSSNATIASVDASGRVTATGIGDATITAHSDTLSATAAVHVVVSTGTGFVTGRVFDDGKGLPLAGATVALIADGSGPLAQPVTVIADDSGRFAVEGQAGDALVRVTTAGFTTVERRATIPAGSAVRVLDARLSAVDARANPIASAFGGAARDSSGAITLTVAPGVMTATSDLRLTAITAQGLQGRLPFGWSPVAAVDVGPAGVGFSQPASLTLPNSAGLAANSDVVVAAYDLDRHDWIVSGSSHVSADGKSIAISVSTTGQIACVAGDDAPFTPPAVAAGAPLTGVAAGDVPVNATATGEVVPRSAPPSPDVRAAGRVLLQNPTPLPSGSVVRAEVSEHFDLTDQSHVVPPPFAEDIVLFARGRPAGAGVLGAIFPITPSRSYTIQELSRGVVSIDVTRPDEGAAATLVGAAGGTVTDTTGDSLEIGPGALAGDAAVALSHIDPDALGIPVPAGFDLLAAVRLNVAGQLLSQPGRLSIAIPPTFNGTDQVVLATVFADPTGALRLRIAGVATVAAGRLTSQTTLGSLTFSGPRSGGDYLFLRPQQPVGFVSGRALGPDTLPRTGVVVTTDTAPFADVSATASPFIVAGVAAADVTVRGSDPSNHDAATRSGHVTARDDVITLDLTLALSVPTITATSPAASATNVPLGSSVVVDFSDAIDPASVSSTTVVLQENSTSVSGQRLLSSDRRRLTFRPDAPLDGKTTFTLTLTGLRSTVGRSVATFALPFTTLDPTKPNATGAGLITGELPDEDGFVLITGGPGAADANAAVTATNLRTQEAATVLAAADGSFRVRVSAAIGDQLTVSLRDSSGRDATISLTQLQSSDGSTALGDPGGTFTGAHARTGTVLPRALSQPGLFRIDDAASGAALATLPDGFSYADQFRLSIQAAQFAALSSFTLTESQNRFAPQTSTAGPFSAAADVTVPSDFLVNASLRFTATAVDASGIRRSATASTLVVSGAPDTTAAESSQTTDFPTVFVTAPNQSAPNQLTHVSAVAPTARIDLELPLPAGVDPGSTFMLVRSAVIGDTPKLLIVDSLAPFTRDNATLLHTTGRTLPGMAVAGDYAVVSSVNPLTFVTGHLNGPTAIATLDGSPFAFQTGGPNGSFALPVRSGQPFAIHYVDAATGAALGSSNGQAPASGSVDLGQPLAPVGTQLTVTVDPDPQAIVDIGTPITFHFSEAVDARTLTSGIVVTDSAGARAFGSVTVASDGVTATFKPARRWRFGTTYRWGVGASVLALSGARQAQAASGTFTTFAPSIVSTTAIGTAHDVAVSGSLAVAATDTGLVALDISSPLAPTVQSQLPLAGGAHGVALLPSTTFTDRNGQSHTGTFAAVANGDTTGAGRLDIIDVTTPASAAAIGSTQVSASGGTPTAVALTADQRAIVSVQGVGAAAVTIGASVPADPANPSRAVTARYPASGSGSVNQAALLGNRIVTAGVDGITVLDASTLARVGGASTTGDARGVAVLPAFSMDVNGDGTLSPDETFDLAVVANGSDGTLQFFRVPASSDPMLLSVVHFTGETTSVAVDANERLAYVGLGARGLGIVDLDGPASVQPVDADRNGTDDRVLSIVDTPGSVERLGLALNRGIAFAADGAGGLTTIQLLPPRMGFLSLVRDPVASAVGDEEPILGSRRAFTSDDAIDVTVDAMLPPGTRATLAIEAQPSNILAFSNDSTAATLSSGLNTFTIAIARGATPVTASLIVRDTSGLAVAALPLRLVAPDFGTATLTSLFVAPPAVTLDGNTDNVRVEVGGRLSDGRTLNLSGSAAGTTYVVPNDAVATTDAEGNITAIAGGTTEIDVENRSVTASGGLQVNRPPALVAFETDTPYLTLVSSDAPVILDVRGKFSDGSTTAAAAIPNTEFVSSDASVVSVSATGAVSAASDGLSTVTISNGTIRTEVGVNVELHTNASITGLSLAPVATALTLDDPTVDVVVTVQGTGMLAGFDVAFLIDGAASADAATSFAGVASARLSSFTIAGPHTIQAQVTDPATGLVRTATQSITIAPASGDNEPNDSNESAPAITGHRVISGSIDSVSDPLDTYRLDAPANGTATIDFTIAQGGAPQSVILIIRDAAGNEISRITPSVLSNHVDVNIPAGAAFITVESTGGTAAYSLAVSYRQGPIAVTSVAPPSGPPGTLVTITGSGFSTAPRNTSVYFGQVLGKVVGVTPTIIQAIVPTYAVNGRLQIVSGTESVLGPTFTTGTTSFPDGYVEPVDESRLRQEPGTGAVYDITSLLVDVDPTVTRDAVDQLAGRTGGIVTGVLPLISSYVFTYDANQTFSGLNAIQQQLTADPSVLSVSPIDQARLFGTTVDMRDNGGAWPAPNASLRRSFAYDQVSLFEAIDAIRRTPPFDDATKLRPVRVVVIDSGFAPFRPQDFTFNGTSVVTYLEQRKTPPSRAARFVARPQRDTQNHGTAVAGVIGALNDGDSYGGVLGSVVPAGAAPPFSILVYACPGGGKRIDTLCALNALHDLADRMRRDSSPIPTVVNMSFGLGFDGQPSAFKKQGTEYAKYFAAFGEFALFVTAAGNDGIYADMEQPGAAASAAPNGLNIGATGPPLFNSRGALALDLTGSLDQRADYGAQDKLPRAVRQCDPAHPLAGSNCGPTLNLVAPGSAITAPSPLSPGFQPLDHSFGTSLAAPIVTGVAAMLQMIRHAEDPGDPAAIPGLRPSDVRDFLISTGDDVALTWAPRGEFDSVFRLNALAAVRAVLPPATQQQIFISDGSVDANGIGHLVGIEVDPLTGGASAAATVIPLSPPTTVTRFASPTTSVIASSTGLLYVIARGSPTVGDGVMVVNTHTGKAHAFIPFSGYDFVGTAPPPIALADPRAALALSQDERLLYVADRSRLFIINTVAETLVSRFDDLPDPFRPWDVSLRPPDSLASRLDTITRELSGESITSIALSADGATLYLILSPGSGTGEQSGAILPVNVNLNTGTSPRPISTTRLDQFLHVGAFTFIEAQGRPVGDEPSASAVNPAGGQLYVAHGGVNAWTSIPNGGATDATFGAFVDPLLLGAGAAGSAGNLTFVANKIHDGFTLLDAPGLFAGFESASSAASIGSTFTLFPSEVVFGWQPPADSGLDVPTSGLIVNQANFAEVYAKRPFGLAMRPDGHRALVAFAQTGNFGVFDSAAEGMFAGGSPRPVGVFTALAGVTQAIAFDQYLSPSRGAFTSPSASLGGVPVGRVRVPSRDEALMFPGPIKYAQNGRFAVAVHSGVTPPVKVAALMPNFAQDNDARLKLVASGFLIDQNANTGLDPDGVTVTSGGPYFVDRGGGAVTILDDTALSDDLSASGPTTLFRRPYFSTRPICAVPASLPHLGCALPPFTRLLTYTVGSSTPAQFNVPRDVSIQPFVGFETPRSGDAMAPATPFVIRWRDARATEASITLHRLAPGAAPEDAVQIGDEDREFLFDAQMTQRSLKLTFEQIIKGVGAVISQSAQRYRIDVTLIGEEGAISSTSVVVVY